MDVQMDAEQKILHAAIECIEEYGLQGATIRRIADKAGQNSAAINYYFRSKDKLLDKAIEVSLANGFDWSDYPIPDNSTALETLELVFLRLVDGARAFPGLTRAHFYAAFLEGKYGQPGILRLNQFLEELMQRVKPRCPEKSEADLRLAITQMAAAAFLYPALLPKAFELFFHRDMTDRETAGEYIHRVVTKLL